MPKWLSIIWPLLAAITLSCTHWIFFELGKQQGKINERAAVAARDMRAMESVVNRIDRLATDANTASLALNKIISDRIVADAKTTKDIRDALSTTAHLRVECVVPRSVMQQLDAARNRANHAAASGFNDALPTTTGAD